MPPFCLNPFANTSTPTLSDLNDSVPPCGCTVCDIPDVVLKYQSMLSSGIAPKTALNCHIYILSNSSGYPIVEPEDAMDNIQQLNQALSQFNISFSANASLYESDFLFYRYVLPFCRPYDIGNGQCDPLCNVSLTGWDGGECGAYIPPANCTTQNGICDDACNYLQYNWDDGDCCTEENALENCKDPDSPLKIWVSEKQMAIDVGVGGEDVFNIYIARYTDCYFCGASSNFPWWYVFSDPASQGSIFRSDTIGPAGFSNGNILVHEIGHTLGLWHVFRFLESGMDMCGFPCYDGIQYPITQNGSMTTGDLCADTRLSPIQFNCTTDPPGTDCAGNPWFDTPVTNYMGFTYSCADTFTMQQGARMRCYMDYYYTNWFLPNS